MSSPRRLALALLAVTASAAGARAQACDEPRSLADLETAAHVRCAMEAGADIHAPVPDHDGQTPLHIAAGWERPEAVQTLIDAGAALDARDESGRTPLHAAADSPGAESLRLLLAAGADPFALADDFEGNGAMHYAVRAENSEAIAALLDAGVPIDQRASDGMTPLMQAAGYGGRSLETLRLVLGHGASVDARDENGDTPLHWTARWDHTDAARLLLERGADPNAATGSLGYTPLHTAFLFSTEAALVPVLLDAGADPRAETGDGRSVLDTAEEVADSEYTDQAAALDALRAALAE